MHRYLLFLVLFCACSSHAQTLHKCSGQGGTIAYRDGNCLPGERLVAVRDAGTDVRHPEQRPPRPGHAPRASKDTGSTREHRRSRRRVARGQARRHKARKNPCSAAKQARDDFQRKRGIKVTMAQLSRWNHRVYDACK